MMQVTFNATGRDIVNALKAGKSVVVHAIEPNGSEEYAAPSMVAFNENTGSFYMNIALGGMSISINNIPLDSTIEYNTSDSTK